uniref:Methylase subunit of polypeptide release factor puta n=1 Tax=Albugo laibachii Nc14 TaxID=890382 RepID=F0WDY1_9STRA|nr:methylase subunit of polypeptide release factor puta [Albugo laibachii Nc14]|eukprot:CCA19409.1 methylase subunit of polypeptide release factor puta [Albugo laibachii Nc14]
MLRQRSLLCKLEAPSDRIRFHSRAVSSVLNDAKLILRNEGRNSNDAKILLANALCPAVTSSNSLFLQLDREVSDGENTNFLSFIRRRCKGEPIAYITGTKEFWSMEFRVDSNTLIPRADSEVLVEAITNEYPKDARLGILDIGTGSGCLLLSALSEYPRAWGLGIDVCSKALDIARENARHHSLEDRCDFMECDLRDISSFSREGLDESFPSAPFDVILFNPPYIPQSERFMVDEEVLIYEPHLALFPSSNDVNNDFGLNLYECLQRVVLRLLGNVHSAERSTTFRKQIACMEIGSQKQAEAVKALFAHLEPKLQFKKTLFDIENRHRGLLFTT